MRVPKIFAETQAGKFRPYTSEYVIRELEVATDALREDRLRLVSEYAVEVMSASEETRGLAMAYIEAGLIRHTVRTASTSRRPQSAAWTSS